MGELVNFFKPNINKLKANNDVEGLIKAAEGKNNKRRNKALKAIAEISDPNAVERLIEAFKALDSKALKSSNLPLYAAIGRSIKEALDGIDHSYHIELVVKYLKEKEHTLYDWAIKTLGKIGESSITNIFKAIKKENWGDQQTYHATLALAEIGPPAVNHLIDALQDDNKEIRAIAAAALGEIKDLKAVDHLIKASNDKIGGVRIKAMIALREIGDERAIKVILNSLNDDEAYIRNSAAYSLIHLERHEYMETIIETLIKNLRDEDQFVRDAAAGNLGKTKDRKAILPLVNIIKKDDSSLVREGADMALRKIVDANRLHKIDKYVRTYLTEKDSQIEKMLYNEIKEIIEK